MNSPAQRRSLAMFIGAGVLGGLLWTYVRPPEYLGQVTVFFPGVQSQMFSSLTRALRASPGDNLATPEGVVSGAEVAPVALIIFQSQAAAVYSLEHADESTGRGWWTKNPLEEFGRTLRVELRDPSTVRIQQQSASGDKARQMLQGLLAYYTDFVAKNRLSRLKKTREATEERLLKTAAYLRTLEEKMTRSSSRELRKIGDAAIKASPQVMSQLWLRRMEEEGRGRELLEKLQKIRGAAGKAKPTESAWMKEWSRGLKANPKAGAVLRRPVGRQELLEQARLERDYDEALLKHRSLVLQHSFLLTLEDLDNFDYEIVDPISVRPRPGDWKWNGLCGALLGCLAGLIHQVLRLDERG